MPEQLSRAVAAVVRRLLDERGITARQLAEASGMNLRAVQRKLADSSPFDLDDLAAIAPVLGVTAADLLTWAEHD